MKAFACIASVDVFSRLFELVIKESTRFNILLAFSLLLTARRICRKIGDLIGFT
jgi:hypothetical protein